MINLKRIATLIGSALMIGSTAAMAAAASYPAPFVSGGAADVAVVVGANAALSDAVAATNIGSDLATALAAQTTTTTTTEASVSGGNAAELFTGGTKIYVSDPLNVVKDVVTEDNLPNVLADGSFSGNVDATYTQNIYVGSNPNITFEKQPTSSDDPAYGLKISTQTANYIYNATVTFSKAINFTHSDSEGEEITLFGQTWTIGSDTTTTSLVMLKTATKLSLDSNSPSADVTIDGETYTIELVSASDTAATVKVTDSSGSSEQKEVSESDSKKINGVEIAVSTADETNLKLSASVIAGSDKITLTNGAAVTVGSEATSIEGTKVTRTATNHWGDTTKIEFSVAADSSDADAINAGESLVDPIFGTFKLDFPGFNIGEDSSAREDITLENSGDYQMQVKFTDYLGDTATVIFANNETPTGIELMHDDDYRNITVLERQNLHVEEYVVVGNEDDGRLLRVSGLKNSSTAGQGSDYAKFKDVFRPEAAELTTTWTSEKTGTVDVGGKSYSVTMNCGTGSTSQSACNVTLNYPDSSGNREAVIYPTIQTSKGALVAFYEPLEINLTTWYDGAANANNLSKIKFPDGDGYFDMDIVIVGNLTNITVEGTSMSTGNAGSSVAFGAGPFAYVANGTAKAGSIKIYLKDTSDNIINAPALMIFEEKDDNNNYNGIIVKLDEDYDADSKGIGVNDVMDTWSNDSVYDNQKVSSDNDLRKDADLWGTITTIDQSDSDQKTAVISYPDEQIYAQLYLAEESASITAGSTSSGTATELGSVTVYDSEVSSVASKNLIVVGGSCINSVAAELIGSAACEADFTAATDIAAGEALIKSYSRNSKVALLVAGYNAADTTKAVTYLTNNAVDTTVGSAMKVTSATEATAIAEAA
jgi:hypothetical protein